MRSNLLTTTVVPRTASFWTVWYKLWASLPLASLSRALYDILITPGLVLRKESKQVNKTIPQAGKKGGRLGGVEDKLEDVEERLFTL